MQALLAATGVDWPVFLLAFAVVVVAAAAQAAIGVGFGIVAAPVLAVVDPALVPGAVLVLAVLTSLIVAVRDRADFRLGALGYALAGRIPFSVLGGLTASLLSPETFLLVFGGLILAAVALSLTGLRVAPTPRNLFIAGSASGYMGTLTSVGTPPMAIVYQHAPGPEVRANMSAFLTVGGLVSILSLAGFGAFGLADLALSLQLVPAMLVGYALSPLLSRHTDRGWMRPAMLALCMAAAALLLARGIGGALDGAPQAAAREAAP